MLIKVQKGEKKTEKVLEFISAFSERIKVSSSL